jgi:hypothetical protein
MRSLYAIMAFTLLVSCTKDFQTKNQSVTIADTTQTDTGKAGWDKYEAWQEKRQYRNTFNRDSMVLARLENSRDEALINSFAKKHDSLLKFKFDSLPKMLHTIDINGDALKDIIFEGSSGGESMITHIYLNLRGGFKPVFTGYQYIQEPKFEKGRLASFSLVNPGCCADPGINEHHYNVTWQGDIPEFHLDRAFYYLETMQKADSLFTTPKPFSITSAKATTRSDCYVLEDFGDGPGNYTGEFSRGDKGKALGWKREDGKDWLYVLMEPARKLGQHKPENVYMYGWVLKAETSLK